MSAIGPVTLRGRAVTLEPLSMEHHDGLVDAVRDGELWNLWYTRIPRPEGMAGEIEGRLDKQRAGSMLPFTARRSDTGEVLGMTTYCNINADTPKVEIGYTWNRLSAQRTGANAESKLLLLTHAFETLGCTAVEFRTHWMNHQSREAISRLGAKQDGVLRGDVRMPDGTVRDTVVFSVIASEWPMVRSHLEYRLAKPCA
ncbi:RimJ/RimL family protein N-acetyltransferase [Arthrobacter pigmenti]|uniref:RimJ/RimL family protein N-acetyltransferase n=1 Tax=Arthrobacter pigmenti TaxID=271432 RepID=A0A846RQL1_9MICC|nr:GNAT family protein [Arthrobacter pigmenti]NJC23369.1 RimJ/RimL family protein N-acetyltransferase [Arthrobacter pigmenti]